MTEYYFDTEVSSLDPDWGRLITAQFGRLYHGQHGWDTNELTILREWEIGERDIIEALIDLGLFDYQGESVWDVVPVGNGLLFDFTYLYHRARKHGLLKDFDLEVFLREKPMVDLRSVLVLLNDFKFKGSGLHTFTQKLRGDMIPYWYHKKEYDRIVEYIELEYQEFANLLREIHSVLRVFGARLRNARQAGGE